MDHFSNHSASFRNGSVTNNGSHGLANLGDKFLATRWSAAVYVLCFFGSLLNLSVLYVLFRQKYHRSGSGSLIVNLVLIYFTLCLAVYPVNGVLVLLKAFAGPIHPMSCNIINALWLGLLYTGNFFEAGLAINRVVALLLPNHYKHCSSKQFIIPLSVCFWVGGMGLGVLLSFGILGTYYLNAWGICLSRYCPCATLGFNVH